MPRARGADKPMIVVTDLDGTLLDHYSYSCSAARPALAELARRNIPVILNTSKTRAELGAVLDALDLKTPYIVENGSAIVGSNPSQAIVLGEARPTILDALRRARQAGYVFTGYADMSVDEVMRETDLGRRQAEQSLVREFSEPLRWEDSEPARKAFIAQMQAQNLQCLQGGRFLHVMGRCDKGRAMQRLLRTFYPAHSGPVVALGDSHNDCAMLELADIAVLVRSPVHAVPAIEARGERIVTESCGPEGWNEAIESLLQRAE